MVKVCGVVCRASKLIEYSVTLSISFSPFMQPPIQSAKIGKISVFLKIIFMINNILISLWLRSRIVNHYAVAIGNKEEVIFYSHAFGMVQFAIGWNIFKNVKGGIHAV